MIRIRTPLQPILEHQIQISTRSRRDIILPSSLPITIPFFTECLPINVEGAIQLQIRKASTKVFFSGPVTKGLPCPPSSFVAIGFFFCQQSA